MLITTRVIKKNGKEFCIDNPRFNIDDIRKIKAFIRKNTVNITVEQKLNHDLNIIMGYGRCISYKVYKGVLYSMIIRVAGKEFDTLYTIEPIYREGKVYLNIYNIVKK